MSKPKKWAQRVPAGLAEYTLTEVADALGISAQCVHQIELNAMNKLKKAYKQRKMDEFLYGK